MKEVITAYWDIVKTEAVIRGQIFTVQRGNGGQQNEEIHSGNGCGVHNDWRVLC